VNRPPVERMAGLMRGLRATPQRIGVMTTAYWGPKGVKLTVGFLDNAPADLRRRILGHMNAWDRDANVNFVASNTDPDFAFQGSAEKTTGIGPMLVRRSGRDPLVRPL